MASRLVKSRKDSTYPEQWFGLIIELVEAYHASAQIVQHSLSDMCKALNKKRTPSHEQCISFIKNVRELQKPLSSLCSAFDELAKLPDTLIPFHLDILMALCNIQSQILEVEKDMKEYYEYIIVSANQELIELRIGIIRLLTSFRMQLNKVHRFLKNALDKTNMGTHAATSAIPNREKEHVQITVAPLARVPHSSHTEQIDRTSQGNAHNGSSKSLSAYKSLLNQRKEQLLEVEKKKVEYLDPRSIPLELDAQEKLLRADIQRFQSEIGVIEQEGETG